MKIPLTLFFFVLALAPKPTIAQSVPAGLKLEWIELTSDLGRRNEIVTALGDEIQKFRFRKKQQLNEMKANAANFQRLLDSLHYDKDAVVPGPDVKF